MPSATKIRQFVRDLAEGKSNTARALDDLFGSPGALQTLQSHPNLNDLKTPGALDKPLPGWAKDELQGRGLSGLPVRGVSDAEIAHVNAWPNAEKEKLRAKLADSVQNVRPLSFLWELTDKPNELIDVPPADSGGNVTIRSPRSRVSLVSPATLGEVRVDVPDVNP